MGVASPDGNGKHLTHESPSLILTLTTDIAK